VSALLPRVLLIEDDPSMQQFVSLVLQDFHLELVSVDSVEAGLGELARAPVALILSDLNMPGLTGFDLVDRLAAEPSLRGNARIAIFSAGLDEAARRRLDRPSVWRLLSKPCRLEELEACVDEALAAQASFVAPVREAVTAGAPDDTIARYFGGDVELFTAFRQACVERFDDDIATGDRASEAGDIDTLHHLSHSLKSVLRMLGLPRDAAIAFALEDACAHAEGADSLAVIRPLWQGLRRVICTLR